MDTIYIRADGNPQIGSGHVMRTLSIAQAIQRFGGSCIYLTADHKADSLIEAGGFEHICLHSKWDALESEIKPMNEFIAAHNFPSILFDSYFATPEYFSALQKTSYCAYLDDFQKQIYPVNCIIHYQADLNHQFYYSNYEVKEIDCYLGALYAPLREEFEGCPPYCVKAQVQKICITSGATDNLNICGIILFMLKSSPQFHTYEIEVIIGKYFKHQKLLEDTFFSYENIQFIHQPTDMKNIFIRNDLVISAAGSTLYELCACGVPTLAFIMVDNQVSAYQMQDLNLLVVGADFRSITPQTTHSFVDAFHAICYNPQQRKHLSKNMQSYVDGYGASRLAQSLLKYSNG